METRPIFNEYNRLKEEYTDRLILFRIDDFFMVYADDAKSASEIIGIKLIKRSGWPDDDKFAYFAGFPCSHIDKFVPKLIRAGKHVCIFDSPLKEDVI